MKRSILIYLIMGLIFISTGCRVSDKDEGYLETDKVKIEDNLKELTRTSRLRGTEDELRNAEYIKEEMDSYGFTTDIQEFDIYKTDVESFFNNTNYFDLNPEKTEAMSKGHNIIADLNRDPDKKTIVFSSHYDTKEDSIGAWDNASGVVSLMEAARLISPEKLDYNLRVIFFSSEEYFMFGSRSYIKSLSEEEVDEIIGHINIDTVGNKDANKIIIETEDGKDNKLTRELKRVLEDEEIENYPGTSSDEVSFQNKGISNFKFTTADYLSKDFDKNLLIEESDLEALSIDRLADTVRVIFDYMKDLKVENIDK